MSRFYDVFNIIRVADSTPESGFTSLYGDATNPSLRTKDSSGVERFTLPQTGVRTASATITGAAYADYDANTNFSLPSSGTYGFEFWTLNNSTVGTPTPQMHHSINGPTLVAGSWYREVYTPGTTTNIREEQNAYDTAGTPAVPVNGMITRLIGQVQVSASGTLALRVRRGTNAGYGLAWGFGVVWRID